MNIGHLISSYGYLALFVLVAVESLGIPLPGETALVIAGTYAGSTHKLSPWLVFLVGAAAAIVGDNIGYWIGDKGGYKLARRYGRKVRLDEHKLKIARYLFDRHGAKVVFFGRFISILRTYAAFLAGTSQMRWRVFLIANAAGGIVWAAIYTVASYFAGTTIQRDSKVVTYVLLGLAVAAIVVGYFLTRRKASQLGERAEAAYPGPLELPAAVGSLSGRRVQGYAPATAAFGKTRCSTLASPLISRPSEAASAAVIRPLNMPMISRGSPLSTRSGAVVAPSRIEALPPATSTVTGVLAVRSSIDRGGPSGSLSRNDQIEKAIQWGRNSSSSGGSPMYLSPHRKKASRTGSSSAPVSVRWNSVVAMGGGASSR